MQGAVQGPGGALAFLVFCTTVDFLRWHGYTLDIRRFVSPVIDSDSIYGGESTLHYFSPIAYIYSCHPGALSSVIDV